MRTLDVSRGSPCTELSSSFIEPRLNLVFIHKTTHSLECADDVGGRSISSCFNGSRKSWCGVLRELRIIRGTAFRSSNDKKLPVGSSQDGADHTAGWMRESLLSPTSRQRFVAQSHLVSKWDR